MLYHSLTYTKSQQTIGISLLARYIHQHANAHTHAKATSSDTAEAGGTPILNMENKADVKAIMARFQANTGSADESSSPSPRHKAPLNLTLSSGPVMPSKKPVLESFSGSTLNLPPKPSSYLKNTVSAKSDTEVLGANKTKALASKFSNTLDDTINKEPLFDRGQTPLKPLEAKSPEVKSPVLKPTLKPPFSTTLSHPKPPGPKPPPAGSKPSWVKEECPPPDPTPPKVPPLHRKPNSSIVKLWQQNETNTDKPSPPTSFMAAQEAFNKEKDKPESDLSMEADSKRPLGANPAAPPPKPPASKKPSLRNPPNASIRNGSTNDGSTSDPKRNPLPNMFTLGPAPAKPKRPPKVDLDDFRRAAGIFTAAGNHGNNTSRPQPPQSALPSLPPRPLGTIVHQEESYDDVDAVNISSPSPPPLPPTTGHPSLRPKEEQDDDSGDMYEPLDETWDEQEKRKEKEEKRQLEAEKKEQKGREKKEQEARKKFKLVGPVEVIHRGKARVDYKGSKTELALKRGDCLDIVRVQGNPEGKWLGRKQDGSIGYVKTTSVEIDFNTLKNHPAQQSSKYDVYDDVDVASSDSSGISGQGVVLPPPPDEDEELYNDVIDPDLDVRRRQPRSSVIKPLGLLKMFERNRRPVSAKVLPPPSQFTAEENPVDEEIYYDVDAQTQPPPPPISSRVKVEETDPKKTKKFEKEEKDFRKKFKYDGEIQVLYQVSISPALGNKKWGGKELAVKAGEKLDVIVKPADKKMICRNEEGKFGYVSTSHISMDDGEIYDDIGDDCIYDND
ncbi:FYN-binding protein 1 isoform X2 [Phyllopteryx taeniolatus]|uniref:FYN-binding protein 1 isoform X2 n=1 Tax=Phyllopteryx taeniolatus TaxID=161469 RepID=UPI002AD2F5AF|nr:FYN-binding protein 1 isoform X2 [Phyllopteryx taeniolatus]